MTDSRGPYRVYHMNRHVKTFESLDDAQLYVIEKGGPDDWEILDRSDS